MLKPLDAALLDSAGLEQARMLLLAGADAARMYAAWFHRDSGDLRAWPDPGVYRAALLDPARYEGGWRVAAAAGGAAGAVVIERGDERRTAAPPAIIPATLADVALGPGATVLVDPIASEAQGGFWHLWSAGWRAARPAALQRIYAPVRPATAIAFLRAASRHAPAAAPWAAKALTGAHDAGRSDAAVLYLAFDQPLGSGWPSALLAEVAPLADGPLPPLVRPLGQGLGWARDPGGDESFGQAAARVLAGLRDVADDAAGFRAAAAAALAPLIGAPA